MWSEIMGKGVKRKPSFKLSFYWKQWNSINSKFKEILWAVQFLTLTLRPRVELLKWGDMGGAVFLRGKVSLMYGPSLCCFFLSSKFRKCLKWMIVCKILVWWHAMNVNVSEKSWFNFKTELKIAKDWTQVKSQDISRVTKIRILIR